MKITDLQMEHYGIYRDESWQPSQDQLTVVMGENESGKTTLLNFIRDMLFGYRRGEWRDRKGNMSFIRDNGDAYRVYRDNKESWFTNKSGETFREELGSLWWHGMNRSLYEKIFAVGLEDLQGAGFLSQNEVKSRFFMLQGGDVLADVQRKNIQEAEKLFVASPQGKRKINDLLAQKRSVEEKLAVLSQQEEDFSSLQKKQKQLEKETSSLKQRIEQAKEQDKTLEKRLGAWEYYKRARDIRHKLDLGDQVKMFPANGKEQWNDLMGRMTVIRDQKEQLQAKLDQYTPRSMEEIIPWASSGKKLEELYTNLGQWRQSEEETEELCRQMEEWKASYRMLGCGLSFWNRPLEQEECGNVSWENGRKLAQSVIVRNNEIHFWEGAEPKVDETDNQADTAVPPVATEEQWKQFQAAADQAEKLLHEKTELTRQLELLKNKEDKPYTFWFWGGLALMAAAAGGLILFYMALSGYEALYAGGISAALSLLAFYMNYRSSHQKAKQMTAMEKELLSIDEEKTRLQNTLQTEIPDNSGEMEKFRAFTGKIRDEFYQYQAQTQAVSWQKETIQRQQNEHKEWEERGKKLHIDLENAQKSWIHWLQEQHLPEVRADDLSSLQEQWQKIYSMQGKGQVISVLLEKAQKKRAEFLQTAGDILEKTDHSLPVTPDSIALIYEENRKRMLEWQSIAEKNRQHEGYRKEMDQLQDQWLACQKEMQALLSLVNAKNADEFAERVTAHEQHDELKKEWDTVRRDMRLYAGSEPAFQELWKALETGQYEEWSAAHQHYGEEIENNTSKLGEQQRQLGGVENEIVRLAGDQTVTPLLQEQQRIAAELKAAVTEWMICIYTQYFLSEAQKQYESGRRPGIIQEASHFLQAMTDGRYTLFVSMDGKEVSIVDGAHNRKESKLWSSGTGDQVYLALRMAMALSFGHQLEPLPIVLDDIFVRFDEKRQKETLRFLFDLGRQQQIFLFTCHRQTMRIAREVGGEKGTGEFIMLQSGHIVKEPVQQEAL